MSAVAIVGASPIGDSPPRTTEESIRHFQGDAICFLAGPAAGRRCRQGSAPGWRRYRTWDEVRAHHEVGHALAGHFCGRFIWELSIIEDRTVHLQKTGYAAGHTWIGLTPEPPAEHPRRERAETDFRLAAQACRVLTLVEPPVDWRGALRIAHRMRAQARALIDGHWPLVMALAEELLRQRELNQSQIARFLKPESRGAYWRNRDNQGGGV